jgi:hypothetical protein
MYALILKGTVVDTSSTPFEVSPEMSWVSCHGDVTSGWRYDGSTWLTPDSTPSVDELQTTYKKRVDSDAEACRLRYITPGDGMVMTYQEKFAQAQAVAAMGQTDANAMSKEDREAQFPTLSASVGLEAPTLWDCAQLVLGKYAAFEQLSLVIERTRLAGKKAISDASDGAAVIAAYEALTWPTP